jgi:predicted kinase
VNTVYILRGVPGSGKSTWAKQNGPGVIVSADQYFMQGGVYKFDPKKIPLAHQRCFRNFIDIVTADRKPERVFVDNTNTSAWELAPYLLAGEAYDWNVEIVTFHIDPRVAAGRNVHGVPEKGVMAMMQRLEEPLMPWWNERHMYWDDASQDWIER